MRRSTGKTKSAISKKPSLPGKAPAAGAGWLSTLAAISPVAIYRADARGHGTWVNEKWCELTGRTFASGLGDGWLAAIHPEDRERLQRAWKAFELSSEPFVSEYRYLRPDGTVCWVLGRATKETDAKGKPVGYIGVAVEITELREVQVAVNHGATHPPTDLTKRELEVAGLLADGKSNKQVAQKLGISVRTAEAHRARIMRKLRVGSLAGLVKYALKHELINS